MRKIKFRAWDKKNKTMAYSDDGNQKYGWFTDNDGCMICVRIEEKRDVKLNNIMQYTGLKDKSGNEIYEGDIVKLKVRHYDDCSRKKLIAEEMQTGVVAFDYCSFGIKDNPEDSCLQLFSWILGLEHEIEVIGDIYRNPELMEAEKC